ncbi:undecaprenyl-diphosphate phosphatase [Desulfovibrio desulfuricans]|uniref:Undecaprenyl-diphosphatase n=1 Tax=Desulfovibrio desulfuricans TaxID=876 RepID=A0A4P7UL19_DESDE|nr:undecaprenyl-diphosphate phosphatase [Desulfovibrio desulfuricans]QCC85574.1 undecaprenyl-diphosphate phosphatase [Desulfovibrio desulfuricans]
MDNLFTALILSIVEGLTEFLPVSSSGHLILVGDLLNFSGERAATFEVVIQLGAILAVVVLYWKRFWGLVRPEPYVRFAGARGIMLLILTSLPASVLGLLLHSTIKTYLFRPVTVLGALVVGAVVMIFVERRKFKPSYITLDDMTPRLALGIGCFQCLALWPGFSRSASTIMGAMLLGSKRSLAAEYSFIAAVPIMIAATGYDMLKSWHLFSAADIPFFAVGMIGSFLAALLAVKVFIALMGRLTLVPFAIYRLLIAPFIYYFMVN